MFCFCLAALQVGASIWAFHAGRGAPVVSLSVQVSAAHPRPRLIPLTPSLAASSQPSRPCPPASLRRWLPLSSLGYFRYALSRFLAPLPSRRLQNCPRRVSLQPPRRHSPWIDATPRRRCEVP